MFSTVAGDLYIYCHPSSKWNILAGIFLPTGRASIFFLALFSCPVEGVYRRNRSLRQRRKWPNNQGPCSFFIPNSFSWLFQESLLLPCWTSTHCLDWNGWCPNIGPVFGMFCRQMTQCVLTASNVGEWDFFQLGFFINFSLFAVSIRRNSSERPRKDH